MSTNVQVETTIARDRADVARYVTDWGNDTDWIGAVTEARLLTDPPLRNGSQVARVASFLGKRIEYTNEVVAYEPERRLEMRSVQAPFPMTVVYEFDDAGDGTRVRITAGGEASGFYRMAGPLLSRMVRRGIEGDLARLKRLLEQSPPPDRPEARSAGS